jgi:SpoVK/Ycf46/Vps4 family AAA+-type ATPase
MKRQIQEYLKAGYPALWMKSWEEERVIKELVWIAKEQGLGLKSWTITKGWIDQETHEQQEMMDPISALECVQSGEDLYLYVFLNFHFYVENPEVIQRIKDLIPVAKQKGRQLIFVSCKLNLPAEIEKEITVIDFDLPTEDDLDDVLEGVLKSVDMGVEIMDRKKLVESALGLTCAEAENAFALALVKHKELNDMAVQSVQQEKANIIKKTGILEYIAPTFHLDDIGGLGLLKTWLNQRKRSFSEEAKAFGLPAPRGILLVGVPGAGKSLTAKAVSASWGLPLLRFDMGQVFGSLLGQSEEQMRKALKTAETISPCILWMDELDKGLAGMSSSGATDSGVSARVFGYFLTWLQEKKKPVFVFATANNISSLPPELLRKGRFDELFWTDLPQPKEREEIFAIHLQKRNRNPKDFDIAALSKASEGYGGSEIEEAIISGLYNAFSQNREITSLDILMALDESQPLSVTMKEQIEKIRDWAKNRARSASERDVAPPSDQAQRRMSL